MFKRIILVAVLIVMVLGVVGSWRIYNSYRTRQAERAARVQQKVEEVTVTIIEGITLDQIGTQFGKSGLFTKDVFDAAVESFDDSSYPITARPAKASLEGYLFPDTYRFAKNDTPETVIGKMLDNFTRRLASIGISEARDNFTIPGFEGIEISGGDNKPGISLYDIIIMASVIEKESGGKGPMSLEEERALVASVFYNRLEIGKALESDATINYVTGKDTPAVSARDLELNSPYNTYKYPGLPPGPIAAPSLGSIRAALKPAQSDFFYFLHKQPSGSAEFSKTFDEHVRKKLSQ